MTMDLRKKRLMAIWGYQQPSSFRICYTALQKVNNSLTMEYYFQRSSTKKLVQARITERGRSSFLDQVQKSYKFSVNRWFVTSHTKLTIKLE
jgi:hypothetical protein